MGFRPIAAVAACALAVMSCTGQKALPARPAYPNAKVFDRGCAALWPGMLAAMDRAGFRLMQHDRTALIASFRWDTAQLPLREGSGLDHGRLAMGEDGTWQTPRELRVDAAVLVLSARNPGCEAVLRVSYSRAQGGFWRGTMSDPVSSGLLESVILSDPVPSIATKHARGRRPS